MRTDIHRVKQITKEMRINDLLYDKLKEEYDCYVSGLRCLDMSHISEAMELLYFHRRILSVLSAHDLPLRSAVGLFSLESRLMKIEARREQYIGDSDTDTDVYYFLMELGYRIYDLITPIGTTVNEMYEKVIPQGR